MLRKFITRTAIIFLLGAWCTYSLSNMCTIQARTATEIHESTLELMGENIQTGYKYNIDIENEEFAVEKKLCEKTIETYHLTISLSSIRSVKIDGSVYEYTDDIGNKWTGNSLCMEDDKGNAILNLLVNVQLSSVRTSLYNDELKIPEIITDNGKQLYVCSLAKSNYGVTFNNVKTIKIPKSVLAINGLPETTQNCDITFDTTKNLLYCKNLGGSNKSYNINDINAIINNEDIKIDYDIYTGAFESATIKGKINLTNSNIYIPKECFYNVTGITGIEIGENVKTIDIDKSAFQGCSELELDNIKINADIEIGEFAFSTCKVSGNLEFLGNTTIHSGAFYNGIYNDTTFLFNNGNVMLYEYALVGVKGLKQISFGTETKDIEVHSGVFATPKETQSDITSLEFNGGDVILHDGSFAAFDTLKELKFNNKGTLTLQGSPFFGNSELALYIPTSKTSSKLESFPLYENPNLFEITFNCPEVTYKQEDETKLWISKPDTYYVSYELITVSTENKASTLAGLSGLNKIICTEKTDEFSIYRSSITNIEIRHKSYTGFYNMEYKITKDDNINEMVFFNPVIIPNITDYRNDYTTETKLRGFNNILKYTNDSVNDSKIQNKEKKYRYADLVTSNMVASTVDGFVLDYGKELTGQNLQVFMRLYDGTKLFPTEKSENNPYGYEITYLPELDAYINNKKENGGTKTYRIQYAGKIADVKVDFSPNYVNNMVMIEKSSNFVEGAILTIDDFLIAEIEYLGGEKINNADKDCISLIDKTKVDIKVNGEKNAPLEMGINFVEIEYERFHTELTVVAEKKEIISINSVQLRQPDIPYYENNTVTNSAIKVSVTYSNGEINTDYKGFAIDENVLKAGENIITVRVGAFKKNFIVNAQPIKIISITAKYTGGAVMEGDAINEDYLSVTANYNDTTNNRTLTKEEYSISPYHIIARETIPIYITYKMDDTIQTRFLVEGIEKVTTPTVMPTTQAAVVTTVPAIIPTVTPTAVATVVPTTTPTVPTAAPTIVPTVIPSANPTVMPTTQAAVVTTMPAIIPTVTPTAVVVTTVPPVGIIGTPTPEVTVKPTVTPTMTPNTTEIIKDSVPMAKPAVTKTKSLLLGAKESIRVSDLKNATYKSNNSKIADANKKGYIVAKKNGTATITVTKKNGTKVAYKVTVKKAPKKVMASFKSKTLKKGKKVTLKAKFEKGCYSNKVSFKSSNSKIATVNQKGVITAKKKGTCKITITTYNKKKVTVKITVK